MCAGRGGVFVAPHEIMASRRKFRGGVAVGGGMQADAKCVEERHPGLQWEGARDRGGSSANIADKPSESCPPPLQPPP